MQATMQTGGEAGADGGRFLSRVEWDRVAAAGAAGMVIGAATGLMSQRKLGTLENVVAPLVGSDSAAVGFAVHEVATGVTGAMYGLLPDPGTVPKAAMQGAAFGGAVWALGPMLGVHLVNDMPFEWGKLEKMSLAGHVMWGAGLAAVSTFAVRKWRESRQERSDEGVMPVAP